MTKQYEVQYCIELYQKIHGVLGLGDFIHSLNNMNKREVMNLSQQMEDEIEQLVFA